VNNQTAAEPEMTEEEFLVRCRTIYRMGLATHAHFRILERWANMVARLEAGQLEIFAELLQEERTRTDGFHNRFRGANDAIGYGVINLVAVLVHPCQICAGDEKAWHIRTGMCPHLQQVALTEAKHERSDS
jgi:hypothetical protein